jgi:hypothetical protein
VYNICIYIYIYIYIYDFVSTLYRSEDSTGDAILEELSGQTVLVLLTVHARTRGAEQQPHSLVARIVLPVHRSLQIDRCAVHLCGISSLSLF